MTGSTRTVLVIGTMDTKARELIFVRDHIVAAGLRAVLVDVSTTGAASSADIAPETVAKAHPAGATAVFTQERGSAVAAMSEALAAWIVKEDVAGAIGLGGSGGTALLAPAFRELPLGVPKLIVSTVASGNVAPYVGSSDLILMPSVTDISGLNRVSRLILQNAAAAICGMVLTAHETPSDERPAIGLTMFGVTTPCVSAVSAALDDSFDCIVFHATGVGGKSMEDLAEWGVLSGIADLTTTELCDRLVGGIMPATPDRILRLAPLGIPYVGSVGAVDMVNFGAPATVPEKHRNRLFHYHNPQITLMRTNRAENAEIGTQIGEALNRFEGPAVLLLPEGGVSALDTPGQPFHDPEADDALFTAIETAFRPATNRRIVRVPHHINDPEFARAAADLLRGMMNEAAK